MTFTNAFDAHERQPLSSAGLRKNSHSTNSLRPIFFGPGGVRAGWRLLMFIAILAVQLGGLLMLARDRGRHLDPTTIPPLLMMANEAILLAMVCLASLIMGRIEARKFGDYGLPLNPVLRKNFGFGSLLGFLAISGTLLVMFLLHAFRITGLALHGGAMLSSLLAWSGAFLGVGLFEEFICRGYAQFTLASGIGFWPAAFVLSAVFALGHAFNPNETAIGVTAVVMFGLLLCLFLRRTGNLWCAVGFHAAYDWGQNFYGVPDSGTLFSQHLFNSSRSGPFWLTGGTVGPEASILTPIALLVVAAVFTHYYRGNLDPMSQAHSAPPTCS
jgi:uncharacterized protein